MPTLHDPERKLLAELREKVLKDGVPYEKTDLSTVLQKIGYEGHPPFLVGTCFVQNQPDHPYDIIMVLKNASTVILYQSEGSDTEPHYWDQLGDFDNASGKYKAVYARNCGTDDLEEVSRTLYPEFNMLKNARDAAGLETRVKEITTEEFAERIVGTMRKEHPLLVESVTAAFKNTVNRHRPPWYIRACRAVKRVFKKDQ